MSNNFCYALLITIVCLLNSCKPENDNNEISIGFSQSIDHDIWRASMEHAMEVEASLHPRVKLKIRNANRQSKQQIKDIEKFIEDKVDAIIVSPFESDSVIPVIEKANSKGIPVIIVDRKINTSNYTAYIGADNVEVGRIAGRHIVSLSNGKANVIEIRGSYYTSPGLDRSLGFNEIVSNYPGIKVIALNALKDQLPEDGFIKALHQIANINYVFAYNDVIAYQASLIAKKEKKDKQIKIIGVDGINGPYGGIQLVKEGVLKATILYPTGGSEAIKLALKVINKEIVPKNNNLNTILIDSLNAGIMSNQFDKITIQQADIEEQQSIIKKQEAKYTTQSNLLKLLIFLFIIVLSLAIYTVYSRITINRKKNELEEKNKKILLQKNKIKEFATELKNSNEARLLFFTGLSHEFKTPVTLILSSVESLRSEFMNKGITVNKEISLMHNNSRRLLRLVNQLLDFRKIEDKKFILRASKTNVLDFSKSIVEDFEKEARKKEIDFSLTTNNPELEIYLDRNLMDKVYFNLLSNAFKFTPEKGKISISLQEDKFNNVLKISFKDSGIGIPEKELKEVFNAFYQGSNNFRNSSGIGLHLSKNFIELHQGSIAINSKSGAEFIITMLLGKEHLDEKSIIKETVLDFVHQSHYLDSEINVLETKNSNDSYSILYIEDNNDLLDFISRKFSDEYTFYSSDGTDAIERALELIPDIIMCDLNLPDKNGFQICEILKKDLRTSHIPIIILTASDDQDSYLKALESGADIFLTKPFDLKVLSQSIKVILFNREKLRFYFTNNILKMEGHSFGASEQDFLRKLNGLIENNIDNAGYSVEELASSLNISRVQLYRKVKAILGISVSDHLNNLRLEKSKRLLKNANQNIAEVSYSVGFSSPNYFSTAFKNKFGVTPSEYRGVK
jgi:signal transduction histidine kinase/AraC-like DNA-binding protein/AmiR/NasT family two-component response regulator